MMKTDLIKKIFLLNLGLAFVEGVVVFWNYIQTPSESAAAVLLGFSPLRLSILAGVLFLLVLLGYLFVSALQTAWWARRAGQFVTKMIEGTRIFWFLISALVISYYLVFSTAPYLGFIAGYRERLFPILIWLGIIVSQLLFSWLYVRAVEFTLFGRFRDVLIPAAIALVCIFLVLLFVAVTRIGLTPDAVYWQEAGVPILFVQVLPLLAAGFLLHLLFVKLKVPESQKVDTLIFISIWAVAFALWASQTPRPAYNMLEPAPPNFQAYPFGDAMLYDVSAQNVLLGKPIPADFWAKPLYSFFLSVLHLIAGPNYSLISLLQVAFLALIPSGVYLLTRILGGSLAGILAAALVILREWNAIRLSNVIQVSHVKLLLSDVFAMGGMVLLTWLLLHWLEKPSARRGIPIAAGGALGLLILMRGHPVLIVPFLYLIGFIFLRSKGPLLWDGILKLTIGLLLVMLPWFWHTYDLTGRFAFQDTASSFATKDAFVQAYAGENNSSSYGQFEAQIVQQALTHPLDVASFVSAHYMHDTIFSYIFLPQSFQVESLRSYVKRLPFWGTWEGELTIESRLLLLIHLSILALGFGAAWRKTRGLIFVPLIIGAAYNLSVAVSRRSGWRFIQPADWVTLVFYAIGLFQVILIVYSLIKKSLYRPVDTQFPEKLVNSPVYANILAGLPFLMIAIALAVAHKAFPVSYPPKDNGTLLQMYQEQTATSDVFELEQFLQQEQATIIYGKAIYPVFFKANVGALNYSWLSFAPQPYKRLAFYVMGPEPAGVIWATDSSPDRFPDGADVIVLGCKTDSGDIDALSVVVTSTDPPIVYDRDAIPPLICPLPNPD